MADTVYSGCRFRSRLEARWAVFFDAVGILWVYLPEESTPEYSPDFWLPEHQWHVEVLPLEGESCEDRRKQISHFDDHPPDGSNGSLCSMGVLILRGLPQTFTLDFFRVAEGKKETWHLLLRCGIDFDKLPAAIAATLAAKFTE